MKKLLTILTAIFVCFSNFSFPALAASPQEGSVNDSGASTYAIVSENYVSEWTTYHTYFYDLVPSGSLVDVRFRVKTTYRYNEATGKVYGSAGTLKIETDTKPYNCDIDINNLTYSVTATSDGYAWKYSNIRFDFNISYGGCDPLTYSRSLGTIYVPG